MQYKDRQLSISATDLAKHLACRHLTSLDLRAARGEIQKIYRHDPSLEVLEQRGLKHEAAYLAHLKERGVAVLHDDATGETHAGLNRTIQGMQAGAGAIVQANLSGNGWHGRADILLRVDTPSHLGNWSYEVVDTKLARETRGGTILQLCLYSELVGRIQGAMPESMHVVSPGRRFEPHTYRLHDFLAYCRFVKSRLQQSIQTNHDSDFYPDPVEHCDVCNWWTVCNGRRRADDHLSFVAGISRLQIQELKRWSVPTLAALAGMPLPLIQRPERGAPESYVRIREQARVQHESRLAGKPAHELLAPEPERGLARLPAPSAGDIFLDFEADPFVEDGGLEYLLGYVTLTSDTADDAGYAATETQLKLTFPSTADPEYTLTWAFDRTNERRMFEGFVDMVMKRRERYPDLHIYHFAAYEPAALKRLMGRYATREDEIDRLLRAGTFVDLHGVVRQALRAGIERYSLKDLEVFYRFERTTDLRTARQSLQILEFALELNEREEIPAEVLKTVEFYNREDCLSTLRLRDWLEDIRYGLVAGGQAIPRPILESGDPSEQVDDRRQRVLALMERLLQGIPDEAAERTGEQQARWLMAHLLEWHRREDKAPWWEFFRLRGLSNEELLYERYAISGLEFVERIDTTKRGIPTDRYRFPVQEMQVRKGDDLEVSTGTFGDVLAIDRKERTIDVKKRSATAGLHPVSVFAHTRINPGKLADALYDLGMSIVENGVDGPGPYRAARDLLLRRPPRLRAGSPAPLYDPEVVIVPEATSLAGQLDCGVLPIQGPPGAGKTYTGARMITSLIRDGRRVGVTAVSHKVIRKLMEEVLKAAAAEGMTVRCMQKLTDKPEVPHPAIVEVTTNEKAVAALHEGQAQVAGGTAWLWARPELAASVDVLFVDEAGQMSLADVLAVSQAAKSIVLLGDPLQLEQPIQGTHPPGVAVSALQHILGAHETMPPGAGLFLSETWRLAPPICEFTSELFYESRLNPRGGLDRQVLTGPTRYAGSGLWYVSAIHEGNQNSSSEEVDIVAEIVNDLLQPGTGWVDMDGKTRPLGLDDILIVSPYNAQIFNIGERIPGAHAGTVDRFQGQEVPVVIYSMATSTPEDAPRGMEFLYSVNRFNVATSRARCVCILVASPRLFEPDCRTPRQMKLANVLCRYRELCHVSIHTAC